MRLLLLLLLLILMPPLLSHAEITITTALNGPDKATPAFKFKNVPSPATNDAATKATFTIIDGARNPAGGDLAKLHDGKMPAADDQRPENFSFKDGTKRARLLVDLGAAIEIKQVNTYSWHPGSRAPQAYTLYASDGAAPDFDPRPKNATDPETRGWKRIAQVDTRPPPDSGKTKGGGQHAVSISDTDGPIGHLRYLLFEISPSSQTDTAAQTFYSEIDVLDTRTPPKFVEYTPPKGARETFKTDDGVYQFTIDTTQAPEMTDWTRTKLVPIITEWYPKLVHLLPSKGYEAPKSIVFNCKKLKEGGAPAFAGGAGVTLNANWFMKNLKGEAGGATVHEMVHLVQHYGDAKKTNPNPAKNPGWLVEGIADYVRWFLYEPQTHGADIGPKRAAKVNYDDSYRVTANFLNWVSLKYDRALVLKLNVACRQGYYTEDIWKKHTGRTLQELNAEWKTALASQPPK